MATANQEFSRYLQFVRKTNGFSQYQLTLNAGLNPSHINRMEAGKRNPPKRENVGKIAEALNLDIKATALLFIAAGYVPNPPYNTIGEMHILQKYLKYLLNEEQLHGRDINYQAE